MLFANLDVTTHVLSWLVVLLADNPSTQHKLRKEVRESSHNLVQYVDRKDTYLQYCILESIRLRPVAGKYPLRPPLIARCAFVTVCAGTAFTIPESSPSPKILGAFQIPAYVITWLRLPPPPLSFSAHNSFISNRPM